MTASELFKAGRLREAVAAQLQEVKAHPADEGRRLNALRRQILIADGDYLGAEHDVADRRAEIDALDEERVPHGGQISVLAEEPEMNIVPASVVVVCAV